MTAPAISTEAMDFARKMFPIPQGIDEQKIPHFERVRESFALDMERYPVSPEKMKKYLDVEAGSFD
ncbi:MAG: hypothetical protein M3Q24_01530 [bacterium]|nr:hypothetical protein [bacterium]